MQKKQYKRYVPYGDHRDGGALRTLTQPPDILITFKFFSYSKPWLSSFEIHLKFVSALSKPTDLESILSFSESQPLIMWSPGA